MNQVAIIVGASSGIGEEMARQLHRTGWTVGLLARRTDRLSQIARELGSKVLTGYMDISRGDCAQGFLAMVKSLGRVDLVIMSAGYGHLNPDHNPLPDRETVAVNVSGFREITSAAFRQFQEQGSGHLAAITSVAALRGNAEGAVYAASKAFQSVYLDGLRDSARQKKLSVFITELQPGFVDTAMMKTSAPLSPIVRGLLVSDASTAVSTDDSSHCSQAEACLHHETVCDHRSFFEAVAAPRHLRFKRTLHSFDGPDADLGPI